MTDLEFDVLDELYFVNSYENIQEETEIEEEDLKKILQSLFNKGYIKCYRDADHEMDDGEVDLETQFKNYFYLASKKGLMAHNGLES